MRDARAATLALLASCATVAACGGGDDADPPRDPAYRAGFEACEPGLQAIADVYGVPATHQAVARAVAREMFPASRRAATAARRGCLDALAGVERR